MQQRRDTAVANKRRQKKKESSQLSIQFFFDLIENRTKYTIMNQHKNIFLQGPMMQAVMNVNVWLKSHSFRQRPISKCIRVTRKPSSPSSSSTATPSTVAPSETVSVSVPVPIALSVVLACPVLVPAVGLPVPMITRRAWTCPRIFVNLHLHMAWFCTGLCG